MTAFDSNKYLTELDSSKYLNELTHNIIPFWIRNGIDRKHGGYYSCLDRDGSLLDPIKMVWVQGRFAWMLATLYADVSKNNKWLQLSKHGIDFIEKHCFDADGRMYFQTLEDGTPLRKRRYVFSETFAAIAFAAYSRASGDKAYAQKALNLFKLILHYKNTPGMLERKYIPGSRDGQGHSLCMILINTAFEIRKAIQDPILDKQISESIDEIEKYFMHPEFEAVLEFVGPNGEFIDTIDGRCINPGHSIETAWFILEEAKHQNWDQRLVKLGTTILDWSWKWGWDTEMGGITYFKDCKNRPPQEYWHDMKFWWTQNEAAIATLYGYLATKNPKYLEWHKLVDNYQFEKLKDYEHGEWFGYLHRDGTLSQPAKGNYYKGPFHIPRMLYKSWQLSQEILETK